MEANLLLGGISSLNIIGCLSEIQKLSSNIFALKVSYNALVFPLKDTTSALKYDLVQNFITISDMKAPNRVPQDYKCGFY
jgi:hypothetical protein